MKFLLDTNIYFAAIVTANTTDFKLIGKYLPHRAVSIETLAAALNTREP